MTTLRLNTTRISFEVAGVLDINSHEQVNRPESPLPRKLLNFSLIDFIRLENL